MDSHLQRTKEGNQVQMFDKQTENTISEGHRDWSDNHHSGKEGYPG